MIKNVIFDIGGVIVKYKHSTYLDHFNFKPEIVDILNDHAFHSIHWKDLAVGKISQEEYVARVSAEIPNLAKEVEIISDNKNFPYMIPPFKETLDLIKRLKNEGYKLFIISNITESTIDYLTSEINGFEALFDGLVYSCRVGMRKPNSDIFEYTINHFGIDPRESIFIDDMERNLIQARKNDFNILHFVSPEKSIPELEKILKEENNKNT